MRRAFLCSNWCAISSGLRSAGRSKRIVCFTLPTGNSASMRAVSRRCRRCLRNCSSRVILQVQLADGSVQTISPSQLPSIDPLGIGLNTAYQKLLNQYPVGNDPAYGQDGGLNFSGFRFNAPDHLNDSAYVAKLDYRLDAAGKHTLSIRGTLQHNTSDQILAQFPGQAPASTLRDNGKGISAHYTAVLSPTLINSFTYGLTRLGLEFSGVTGTGFQFEPTALAPFQNFNARPRGRTNPLNNFLDDITWVKGKHTITAGLNFRLNRNNISSDVSSFPLYAYGATELIGLGEDIDNSVSAISGQRAACESDRGDQCVSRAAGNSQRRFRYLSIQQERPVAAAGDAAAEVIHRRHIQRLRGRCLACEPRTHHQRRSALRKLPAALRGERPAGGHHGSFEPVFRAAERRTTAGHTGESDVRFHAQLRLEWAGERQTFLVVSEQQGLCPAVRPGVRAHRAWQSSR